MNSWQVIKQLRFLIKAETWPDEAAEKVVSDVLLTPALPEEAWGDVRTPWVMLAPADATADDQNPDLLTQRFKMLLVCSAAGDHHGESVLVGTGRGGGQGSSKGRGILEVEEEVLDASGKLTGADGVNLICTRKGTAGLLRVGDMSFLAYREYTLECLVTRQRYYHPPRNLAKSSSTVSWALPPARFDRYRILLNRKSGATAPSSAHDSTATDVSLGSDLATSVSDATSGTWTYAVWCAYDETHSGKPRTEERYSDAGATYPGTTLTVS